jgi:altronate hydrolase
LAARKRGWIDFDAGRLLEDRTMQELTDDLWDQIIRTAWGEEQTKTNRTYSGRLQFLKTG